MPNAPEVGSVWFDDGNLIVIAEPKVFRVYQGLLARRSPVIRDLLSIPGANNVIDEADRRVLDALGRDTTGCAVVRLTDKPQEVDWFLAAFIGDRCGCCCIYLLDVQPALTDDSLSGQYSQNLSALAGILRLATKYEVNILRKWVVECLEAALGWIDFSVAMVLELMRQQKKGAKGVDGMFPLIDVASKVGVQWLLRIVYWRLQNTSLPEILHHPEWMELPEEQKTHYLLCRERARDDAFSAFAVVARLHRDGTRHDTPTQGQCINRFKDTLHREFTRTGPKAFNNFDWEEYATGLTCGLCKANYVNVEREVVSEAFVLLQQHMGVPVIHELIAQRERFFQAVSVDSA